MRNLFIIIWSPSILPSSIIHVPAQQTLWNLLFQALIFCRVIEITCLIICITIFFSVTKNGRATFMLSVSGFALRARLISIPPFILIAWPAHWKCTNIACHKWITVQSFANVITTNLADLSTHTLQGLCLSNHSFTS
uniref:Cellulose synthase n=1 Tax=Rhizophora mucronata TaxID=61149 RepID=A0A2P2JA12_RHIMU